MTPEQTLKAIEKEHRAEEWTPYPGAQTLAMTSPAREIFFGGARGPGKSWLQRLWLARMAVEEAKPGVLRYPTYKGAILRYHAIDLRDWHKEAELLYCAKLGAKPAGNPREYKFPGGPLIRSGHLQDGAYIHYVGWEIHKLALDEATHLPTVTNRETGVPESPDYMLLNSGSVRLSPDGNPQAFLTGNPGFKGDRWVKHRFIKVFSDGKLIEPRTPFRDPISGSMRIFINATVFDNPWILQNNPGYVRGLMELSPSKQQAWIYGNWDAYEGQFFDFDPVKHVIEPEQAREATPPHVYRWLSCDWGYSHPCAVHGYAQGLDGRIHVFRELGFEGKTGSFEVGMEIAKAFLAEIESLPDNSLTLYLSHDAFHREDSGDRRVDTMRAGIMTVLGPQSCFILEMNEDEKTEAMHDPDVAVRRMNVRRAQSTRGYGITICRADKNSVAGWDYMRELLRTEQVVIQGEPDAAIVQRLRNNPNGEALVANYLRGFDKRAELLPKILIHSCCKRLIDTIGEMQHDPKDPEKMLKTDGDDYVDSCFVAGTMVRCERGEVPIEQVAVGERVWTRDGLKPVIANGITRSSAPVFEVKLSDGNALTGTGNHPIFVKGKGWILLDSLAYGDILETWQMSLNSRELSTEDTQSLSGSISGPIIGRPATTATEASGPSIRKFGRTLTAQYQRASRFTTKTKIPSTIPSIIWRRCREASTNLFTWGAQFTILSTWPQFAHLPSRGIGLPKGWSGIASTPQRALEADHLSKWSARFVGNPTKQSAPKSQRCAAINAMPSIAGTPSWITLARCVSAAAKSIFQTVTTRLSSAPVRVLSVSERGLASVYNLSVADTPEYFANGVLVHNCMYGVMAHRNQQNSMPLPYYVATQIQEAFQGRTVDISMAHLMNLKSKENYEKEFGSQAPMRLGRFAGRGALGIQ